MIKQVTQGYGIKKWIGVMVACVMCGPALGFSQPQEQMPNQTGAPVVAEQGIPWSDRVTDPGTSILKAVYDYDYGDPTPAEQAHLEESYCPVVFRHVCPGRGV